MDARLLHSGMTVRSNFVVTLRMFGSEYEMLILGWSKRWGVATRVVPPPVSLLFGGNNNSNRIVNGRVGQAIGDRLHYAVFGGTRIGAGLTRRLIRTKTG